MNMINECYGITKDSNTKDFMLIMEYFGSDLKHYLTNKFDNNKVMPIEIHYKRS